MPFKNACSARDLATEMIGLASENAQWFTACVHSRKPDMPVRRLLVAALNDESPSFGQPLTNSTFAGFISA